ncbi:uncharacterized protein LOC135173678 [Pogoniulus pusillus]|uniref:uncharacterized protein LOC135173678 n=1 Tax=Pogoniulus pusillus TaxID=488313 RepID=UPI0030B94E1D
MCHPCYALGGWGADCPSPLRGGYLLVSVPTSTPTAGQGGHACGQATTPLRRAGADRTTFPSGSSRGCTCSVRLPAPPGAATGVAQGHSWCSRRCGSRWPSALLPAQPSAASGAAPSAVRGAARQVPGASSEATGRAAGLISARSSLTAGPGLAFPLAPPSSMPRGRAWTQAEVSSLLALVEGSGEATLLMASTSRPNEALWREISRGLAAAGYGRSVAQCRSKWKALKQAFHSERETRRRAGHHSPRLPPHYQTMKSIWKAAGRPVFGDRRMPDLVKQLPRKHRSALATRFPSSPEPAEDDGGDSSGVLLSPLLQRVKDEPETSASGNHVAGVPPTPTIVPHTGCCLPPLPVLGCHTALKQERDDQKASFPGETSPGIGRGNHMLPVTAAALGSSRTATTSEHLAAGEEASYASLHGFGVAGLLQSVQQLLVQILQTSRQQQALLESLASDTVSHLHLLSHSLVQVGETLHQLLLHPQMHPNPFSHHMPHMSLFEGGSGVPCSTGTPHTSPDHKEEPRMPPTTSCTPL